MTNSLFTLPVDDIRAMYAVEGRKTRLNTDLRHKPFSHVGGGRNVGKTLYLQQFGRVLRPTQPKK
jgi:hypothetical protein